MRAFVCIAALMCFSVVAFGAPEDGAMATTFSASQTSGGEGDDPIQMIGAPGNNCSDVYPVGVLPTAWAFFYSPGTCGAGDDFDVQADSVGLCDSMGTSSAEDEIWQFQVSETALWTIGTCYAGYGWCFYFDSSVMIYDGTSGCPGTPYACDGDACGGGDGGWASSIIDVYLQAGVDYYFVVDAFSPASCGSYYWFSEKTADLCEDDEDCDDGLACNGEETCSVEGLCVASEEIVCPCYQRCIDPVGTCVDPDPCYVWWTVDGSGYGPPGLLPWSTAYSRQADDIELEDHGSTRNLVSYRMWYAGYTHWAGDPVGTPYQVEMALFLTEFGTCMPWVPYPDTECGPYDLEIQESGTDPQPLLCEPAGGLPTDLILYDNPNSADLCGTDHYMVAWTLGLPSGAAGHMTGDYVNTNCPGQDGVNSVKYVGGLGMEDEYGNDRWFIESDFGVGDWSGKYWSDGVADFGDAFICTVPGGGCCYDTGGCDDGLSEAECDTAGGVFQGVNTMADPVGCEDPDGDDFFGTVDNCPDVPNPGQEDCNDDGEGDACEPYDEQDDDGDGTCNIDDLCPQDPFKTAPGQCGCGNPDTDSDGDGTADCNDECPENPLWQEEPACGCDSTGYDNEDDDGDGVENCFDTCAGVDDNVYGPCDEPIPTVSEWGLVILALLLLAAGKVYFGRRPELG